MLMIGRILVIVSIALIFVAYSFFAPTALASQAIAEYTKNHFVREMIFGITLAIYLVLSDASTANCGRRLPFWARLWYCRFA